MQKRKGWKLAVPVLVLAFLLGGCALGPKGALLITSEGFNDTVTQYRAYYQNAPAEEQEWLEKEVHPLVIEALEVLARLQDAMLLGIEGLTGDKERFRELRYELYRKLPKIFKLEEG